jgi:hypothetical protein
MADVLRLKQYTTYMLDGRSSATYGALKGECIVAVVLGYEPLVCPEENAVDVDAIILDMAKHIQRCRKSDKQLPASRRTNPKTKRQPQ